MTNSVPGREKQIEDFRTVVTALRKDFQEGKVVEINFDEVSPDPDRHKGKLLKSRVYLIGAVSRQITVGTSREDVIRGGTIIRSDSHDVGQKAIDLFWSLKREDKITVTYGIVNSQNIIFFNIEK
jgi:hypothetical protein